MVPFTSFRVTLTGNALHDPIHEFHPEPQVLDRPPLVVPVHRPGVRLRQPEGAEPVGPDSESPVIVAVGEAGVHRGGDQRTRIHRLEIPFGRFERRIELPPGRFDVVQRDLIDGCLILGLKKL